MSTLYNVEPQPTAKVLLQTTAGDVLLELFAKQTPLASRNFIQLCLDGYYNNTIFHRLVRDFIIQGGDPTGTGDGGEAIYDGGTFADEFHSRLRFNRRGLLGMANSGQKNDNGSQFFLTLGKTDELDGKNTMFGRVVGDTIFNVMKMGEADLLDLDGSERPLYPYKITGAEVLVNPFEGMLPRQVIPIIKDDEHKPVKKKLKKKAGKSLLSFENGEAVEDESFGRRSKLNPKLVVPNRNNGNRAQVKPRDVVTNHIEGKSMEYPQIEGKEGHTHTSKARPRSSSRSASLESTATLKKQSVNPEHQLPLPNEERPSRSSSSSPEPAEVVKVTSLLDRTNAQISELRASMKRTVPSSASENGSKKSALEQLVPANAVRGRKRKQTGQDSSRNEAKTLKMLDAFRAKLNKAPIEHGVGQETDKNRNAKDMPIAQGSLEDEEAGLCDLHFIINCQSCRSWDQNIEPTGVGIDTDTEGWMSHSLNFEKDRLGKDLTWKKKNEEELVVIDPREKARGIKEEQRAKRRA